MSKRAKLRLKRRAKAKVQSLKALHDPYSSYYYDPMFYAAKGKGKMLAMQAAWADTYDEESDYWYF